MALIKHKSGPHPRELVEGGEGRFLFCLSRRTGPLGRCLGFDLNLIKAGHV